ncbi:MAG TPA: amidohydrolase family protein, partial [Polyangia bacterium]|nr:amidohydrolase family protein [Polyangia bacterium]
MPDPQLDLVLRGGTVVTVEGQRAADVGIRDGRVAVIRDRADNTDGSPLAAAREIDATGRLLLPGGVDPHVHLHTEGVDPGEPTWVDDYTSGSQAALAGGITSVGNMSYVLPWETIAARVRAEETLVARQAIADVFFHTVIITPSPAIVEEVGGAVRGGQSSMKVFMCL